MDSDSEDQIGTPPSDICVVQPLGEPSLRVSAVSTAPHDLSGDDTVLQLGFLSILF